MYQVITKAIPIFALTNQILWKSFTGMRKERSCIFSQFSCFTRSWYMTGEKQRKQWQPGHQED